MNELTYIRSGDYWIPNLSLSPQESKPLGKYARMRKAYLQEHRPVLWNRLILTEKLADIHAGLYDYSQIVTQQDMVDFIEIEFGRIGADTHITPREVIRDFIEVLDIVHSASSMRKIKKTRNIHIE